MAESRGTILVVDDAPANLQLLESILQEKGYTVRAAINGQMALKAVSHQAPDIILLDINMPSMNGYEVCRALKSDPLLAEIPVIFVSAAVETADKLHAFEEGGVDYVTKPFQPLEVLARVETHLTLSRVRRELERKNSQLEQAMRDLRLAQTQLVQYVRKMSALPSATRAPYWLRPFGGGGESAPPVSLSALPDRIRNEPACTRSAFSNSCQA
jgi:CheY-like chemotaxis protein